MRIRKTVEADIETLQTLIVAVWHHTYDRTIGARRVTEITGEMHAPHRLKAELGHESACSLVAVEAGRLIGHALGLRHANGEMTLARLYVVPAAQRRGIGTALLQAVRAAGPDGAAVTLEVEEANQQARAFYERSGFRICGRRDSCQDQAGIPILVMRWEHQNP